MEFKTALELDINSQEDFDDSEFAGVDKLINIDLLRMLFISSQEDESIIDHYFFIESNGAYLAGEDGFVLYELDEIKFVLIDLIDIFWIIIKSKDKEEVELMFE